jgi:hypothetical protein
MNPLWMVAILFLFVIGGAVLLTWIIETGVSKLGAIVVVGGRSLYRSEEEAIVLFGNRFEAITRARGRVLLVDGPDVRELKETDIEEALTVEALTVNEATALVSRPSNGKTTYIVRNNELALKALSLLQRQDELAAHYRAHPELCTSFERSDKSTFVSGI